jgi:tetratricopeptide (TPR) repeat protein
VIYSVNYDIPWEIDVYYIPVVLVLALWNGSALVEIGLRLRSVAVILPVVALLTLAHNYRINDRSAHRIALAYGRDILSTCPQGATLILPETDATFAVLYLTEVEKQRKDLAIWVQATGGLKTFAEAVNPDFAPVRPLRVLTQAKGPVFYTHPIGPDSISGYRDVPYGILYRIERKDSASAARSPDFRMYELERFTNPLPNFYLDDRSRVILANYLLSRGDQEHAASRAAEASRHYETAERLAGDIAEIRSRLGLRYAELGDTDAAISFLRQSLQENEDAIAYNRLGRLLVQAKRYEEAKSAFENAIRIDPNFAMAHSNLGALYGQQNDLERALRELHTALRLDESNALAHNNLGRVYLLSGKREQAIAEWKASLAIDPSQPEIRNQLLELGQTP